MTDTERSSISLPRLLAVMAALRDPVSGCPWDRVQDFASIAPYTVEEAYEVADAIMNKDPSALRDELGDLLFQVVYHARLAEERGWFDFEAVAAGVTAKMIRRHPHVFGDATMRDAGAQTAAWEADKARERAGQAETGVLDGIATTLPPLLRAQKLASRAARVGFDWPDAAAVLDKLDEEIAELRAELPGSDPERIEDELGDLFFVMVNLARKLGCSGDAALRRANAKFERRFRAVEALLAGTGTTPEQAGLDAMEALWRQVKAGEPRSGEQLP
ncbi:nucleoside triphosphate pyrophosphohydrolase [Acidiphilium sp. PA]|uniref:nucleoside triphosphate pyrophosphohydrolase n=1 Tax=Acidiphilium sp. PA TaxID=2871705 RepID=UPI002242C650|nr:nucleoside triphosphate pyrophosphohydrolase [Acidiphilium sp. PA]MCW8307444.1 nucleoside triphosphate pyrophosphohydrolase [Acidiphilium sp. PA]